MQQRNLLLKARYAREIADLGLPSHEENFTYGFVDWEIPIKEAALVLVDCWAAHQVESVEQRTRRIAQETLLPTVVACRRAGLAVIHAPSEGWAGNYPDWRLVPQGPVESPPGNAQPPWPPPEFIRREGEYAQFVVPRLADDPAFKEWHKRNPLESLRIFDFLGPEKGDFMVGDAGELQQLCHARGILHLIFAGFATNICVRFRDYGMHPMKARGYNVLLLRDCTTGIEFGETLAGMQLTRGAITDIEMKVGPTITSTQLQEACMACVD